MTTPLVRFTPTALSGILVELASVRPAQLADDLHKTFVGTGRYYQGEPAVLDFGQIADWPSAVDWGGIVVLMRRIGLQPVGVRSVPDAHHQALIRYPLALLDKIALEDQASSHAAAAQDSAMPSHTCKDEPETVTSGSTLFVDRPVRSGVRIYHPDGDVVLTQGVNPGGEVIAGGNIHCWGPLAGRAIAGAHGFEAARILVARFTPELVAIAGIYKTFEQGVAPNLAGKAVQVRLQKGAAAEDLRLQFDLIEG